MRTCVGMTLCLIFLLCSVSSSYADAPAVEAQDNSGFLYGRVTTTLGDVYEGFLRWGVEEAFWDDLFHATKETLPYLERDSTGVAPRGDRSRLAIAHWKVHSSYEVSSYSRLFIARFGDIESIQVYGDDRAHLIMRTGEEHEVSGGTNDVNGIIRIQDLELGDVEVEWRRIERIEFMQAPAGIAPHVRRLFGTVQTNSGQFEGYVQWDRQECLSADVLNGTSDGEDMQIPMGRIRSIQRYLNEACTVILADGRELLLDGANDVDNRNRGIMIEDVRFGRVTIPWSEFQRIQFSSVPESGVGYEQFGVGGALRGSVTDVDGNRQSGEIVFDLDESKGWEMLNGSSQDIEFEIPFDNVASITRKGSDASHVVLRSGEQLELNSSSDVTDRNAGVLVVQGGDWENPLYLAWPRVGRIDFVH